MNKYAGLSLPIRTETSIEKNENLNNRFISLRYAWLKLGRFYNGVWYGWRAVHDPFHLELISGGVIILDQLVHNEHLLGLPSGSIRKRKIGLTRPENQE